MQFKFRAMNPKPDKKSRIATFDIETFGLEAGDSYATGFYDGKNYYSWEGINTTLESFIDHYLKFKYRSYTCYAHNGGKFDFLYLMHAIKTKLPNAQLIPIMQGARIIQLTIKDKNNHKWTFKDSYPIFSTTLKKLLQDFKCETQKGDFDHNKINPNNWKTLAPEFRPYLQADCKGLHEALTKFEIQTLIETGVSLKNICTTAQLAMRTYRKKFFPQTKIMEINNYQASEKNIRKAYYGGRTEIFKQKGENLNYYDVNSLYPDVMRNNDMPIGIPIKSFDMEINDFGIAYAEVTCPNYINIPVLPRKAKIQGQKKLFFPQGTWSGWYCTPELQKALEIGYTIKIHYGYKFQRARMFNEYIDYFYEKKKTTERNSPQNQLAKLCLNSLYGKFGQRRERKKLIFNPTSTTGMTCLDAYGDSNCWQENTHSDSTSILPAIACFVTCYARLKLYSYLEHDDSVCYCDTDSIITNKVHKTGKELGQLKLEKQIMRAIFLRPKTYYLETSEGETDIKAKGYLESHRKKLTYQDYENALAHNYTAFTSETKRIMSMASALRRSKKYLASTLLKKSIKSEYDKRIFTPTGSIPINITQLETQEQTIAELIEFDTTNDEWYI